MSNPKVEESSLQSGSVPPCRLERRDIEKLASLIGYDAERPSGSGCSFKIRARAGDRLLTSTDVAQFLSDEDLPPRLGYLGIAYHDADGLSVEVEFFRRWNRIWVNSPDEEVSLGKYGRIARFLRSKRLPLWWLHTRMGSLFGDLVLLIALYSLVLSEIWLALESVSSPFVRDFLFTILGGLMCWPTNFAWDRSFSGSQIYVRGDPPRLTKDDILKLVSALIALISAAVNVISRLGH